MEVNIVLFIVICAFAFVGLVTVATLFVAAHSLNKSIDSGNLVFQSEGLETKRKKPRKAEDHVTANKNKTKISKTAGKPAPKKQDKAKKGK